MPSKRVSGLLASLLRGDVVTSSLKDTQLDSHIGYTLPVRLRSDEAATLATKLLLHNPNPFQAEFCIFFLHDEDRFTHPTKSIGARQTIEVDLLLAQREGLKGELGNVIPMGPIDGQVKVVFHTESEKKLLAMGLIEGRNGQQITTFEECISCPPTLSYLNLSPSVIEGIPAGYGLGSSNDEQVFLVEAGWEGGSSKLVNGSALEDVEDEKIAQITSLDRVTLKRIGNTTMTAEYGDCVQYAPPEMFDPFGGADCVCTLTDVLTDQSQVRGTCGTPNVPLFLERNDLIPMYQDSFDEDGVQFIPLCTDFTNSSCATHFSFSEWVFNTSGFLYFEAIMKASICSGLDGVRAQHGGPLGLNSGYRSPDHQAVVNPGAPNSRHQYGDAADIQILDWDQDGRRDDDWERIQGFAKAEGACVEPQTLSGVGHVHMDYRPTCPAGW